MGISTVLIGTLPTYASIGVLAPILLAVFRFGQGFGLGGEWGGAVLLATENAPPGKRAWFGMFPQLGAPLGFVFSGGIYLLLSERLSNSQFLSYGWRIPFLASSVLVLVGLYVRLRIAETPAFLAAVEKQERVAMPAMTVFRDHARTLVLGTLMALALFVIFYLLTVFCMNWGTTKEGFSRNQFLVIQMIGNLFFALTIPISAVLAERRGRRFILMWVSVCIAGFGLLFGPLFDAGLGGALVVMVVGFTLTGLAYGPLGTKLSELFPTAVRYTGASLCFNFAGIIGGSLTPLFAAGLAKNFGVKAVGWYLTVAALLSVAALWRMPESRSDGAMASSSSPLAAEPS